MPSCVLCLSTLLCFAFSSASTSIDLSSDCSDQECHSGRLPRHHRPKALFRMSPYSQSLSPPENRHALSADEHTSQDENEGSGPMSNVLKALLLEDQYHPEMAMWMDDCPGSPGVEFQYPSRNERAKPFESTGTLQKQTPPLLLRSIKAAKVNNELPEIQVVDSNSTPIGGPIKSPPVPMVQSANLMKVKSVKKK